MLKFKDSEAGEEVKKAEADKITAEFEEKDIIVKLKGYDIVLPCAVAVNHLAERPAFLKIEARGSARPGDFALRFRK